MPPFDENLLRFLRMSNVFGPTAPAGGDDWFNHSIGDRDRRMLGGFPGRQSIPRINEMPPGNPQILGSSQAMPIQQQSVLTELEQFKPETRASERLDQLLSQMPQRNKPGKLSKIVASLSGGGPDAQDRILYAPYFRQMQDFNMQLQPATRAAELERYQNVNLRQIADSIANRRIQEQRVDVASKQADTSRMRAESYIAFNKFKIENPDWDIVKVEGGNYILVNPKTGESRDTGVKTGTMSEIDEINLRIKGQKEVAAIPRTVYGTSTTATITPPGAEQPTQQRQRMINNAQQFINANPIYANAIEFDPDTGLPLIKKVGTRLTGSALGTLFGGESRTLTQDDIDKINAAINEQKPSGPATTSTTQRETVSQRGGAPKPATTAPQAPPGWKYIPKAGGGWTAVEDK